MNPFEQYTLIVGVLAVFIEGYSYVRGFLRKVFLSVILIEKNPQPA
jgi:hypothetical protein